MLFLGRHEPYWWNTCGGMGGMPGCCWNTWWNSTFPTCDGRLGWLCGTDRIGWNSDFAASIIGCWWCHTSHCCNRQFWLHIHWIEGVWTMHIELSFNIPWLSFSLQLKMRRLRPWFNHGPGPPQNGIVWKPHPIWIRLRCWLIDCTSVVPCCKDMDNILKGLVQEGFISKRKLAYMFITKV